MDPAVKLEIEAAVREALVMTGVAGTITLVGKQLELKSGGVPTAIDVDMLGEQWALLPPDLKMRKAGELARRLAEAHHATAPKAKVAVPGKNPSRVIVLPLGGATMLLVVAFFVIWLWRGGGSSTPDPSPGVKPSASARATESDDEARARKARVCEATRKRIYSGAGMGPFDVDGWSFELWLASKKGNPGDSPKLKAMLTGGRLGPDTDETLAKVENAGVEVADGLSEADAKRAPGWSATTIRFFGNYVSGFLDVGERPRLLAAADRLAAASGAEVSALYGRCTHLAVHDIGVLYRGTGAPSATAALVYSMGLFAETPVVDRAALDALPGGEIDGLLGAAAKIDRATLASLVGDAGGSVTDAGGVVSVVFPLGGPTRAISASRTLARKLKLSSANN